MGSVLPLLLAVLVQALGESGLTVGIEAPWAVPALVALPYLAAARARRAAFVGRFRAAERWSGLVRLSGVLAFALAALALGWITSVQRWTGATLGALAWPEPAILLALAPFLAFQCAALHAEVQAHAAPGAARRRLLAFQLRGFALVLVPVGLYLLVAWLVGAHPVARAWLEHVGLAQGLFAAAVVGFVAFVLPYLLRRIWDTEPVPEGPARRILELVARRAGFRPAEWLVWRTGGSMANAAVVGFTPFGRVVLFTDELLAQLGPRELVAVVGHEIGHTQRRHVWILLAWALALVLGTDLVLSVSLDRFLPAGAEEGGLGLALGLGLTALLLGFGAAGFGWLSRRLELDADLYCAELTGDGAALASALRRVDGSWERGGWRHFSSARRVEFLAEALASPPRARRFKRLVATLGLVGGVSAAAAVAAEVHALATRMPVERIDAALALGRYDDAARYAAELATGELDTEERQELELVLAAGRSLGEAAAADAARTALEHQLGVLVAAWPPSGAPAEAAAEALERAFGLAFVATLRGGPELAPLMEALRAARRGDELGVERGLAALAPELRDELGGPLARAASRARPIPAIDVGG